MPSVTKSVSLFDRTRPPIELHQATSGIKKPEAISRAAGQFFPMMSVCRCFARRVKFDEKAANPVRRIRTAFAVCTAAHEKARSGFADAGL
jgi:hypothetical protein